MAHSIGDRNYDDETLNKLQGLLWSMAKDIIKLCEDNEISIFASGGTAIGALRHEGFIPWDDDIDFIMTREHYNRFLEVAREKLPDKYVLMEPGWHKNALVLFVKIGLKGTRLVENEKWDLECPINIDIFPYDEVPVEPVLLKKRIRMGWFWCKIYCLRVTGNPIFEAKGFVADMARFAFKIIHGTLALFRVKKSWIEKKYLECVTKPLSEKEKSKDGRRLYTDYTYIKPEKVVFYDSDIYPIKKVAFEDATIPLMANEEEYLTRQYGDYMQLPPEEKRMNHFPHLLDFGDY